MVVVRPIIDEPIVHCKATAGRHFSFALKGPITYFVEHDLVRGTFLEFSDFSTNFSEATQKLAPHSVLQQAK